VTGNRARLAVAVLAATLALGACGGSGGNDSGSTGAGSAGPTTTAKPVDNGVAAKTADQILQETQSALRSANSTHVVGKFVEGTQSVDFDMHLGRDASQGSLTQKGTKLEMIVASGTLYLRGKQFWEANAPQSIADKVGDRWARLPVTSLREGLAYKDLLNLDSFAANVLKPDGKLTKGKTGTVDGAPAIAISDGSSPLWVATTGPAYPLRLGPEKPSTSTSFATFSDYNVPLSVTAPGDSVDLSQASG
jgi:hypothetical protein